MEGYKKIKSGMSIDDIASEIDMQIKKHDALEIKYIRTYSGIDGSQDRYESYIIPPSGDCSGEVSGSSFIGAAELGGLGDIIKSQTMGSDPPAQIRVICPLEGEQYGVFYKTSIIKDTPYLRRIK